MAGTAVGGNLLDTIVTEGGDEGGRGDVLVTPTDA